MAQFRISETRLRTILSRQHHDKWGRDYVASIFADPKEAPGISTASILRAAKLGLRECHCLSSNETGYALLGLYHPDCWDVHEQRMMSPGPRPHYLYGHPSASGIALNSFLGTLDVTERLGVLAKHPKVRVLTGRDTGTWSYLPFPYISDLNLFMTDRDGAYIVNWPIKDKKEDFRVRVKKNSTSTTGEGDAFDTRIRIEQTYFNDANIRSQLLAGKELNNHVKWNLRDLFLDHSFKTSVSDSSRLEILDIYKDVIGVDRPAYLVAHQIALAFKITPREATAILKQGIWCRQLRVDLFQPVDISKPLRPERLDILTEYREWFKR